MHWGCAFLSFPTLIFPRFSAKPIRIITGRGNHSNNGVSVIKPAVSRALREEGWKMDIGDAYIDVKGRL
jgi:hypothetical protein